MKIGIVADSHDNLPIIKKAVERLDREGIEVILHAGDFVAPFAVREFLKAKARFIGVFGNNDGERQGLVKACAEIQPGPRLVELGGLRIVLAHDEGTIPPHMLNQADVAVFGHTHKVVVEKGKILRVNPGECGGWLTGRCTVGMINTVSLEVNIIDI